MGPPRLSLVSGAGKSAGDDHAAGKVAAPANDAVGPVEEPAAQGSSTSPVHDLINSIETRTSTTAVEPPAEPSLELRENLRILEAVIFAAAEPLDEARLATYLKPGDDVAGLMAELQKGYGSRGVTLVKVAGKWAFRTAEDLSWVLERHAKQERRLSKAALETLAIVAYHQPATRAEIEEIRGVSISKGTLDVLMEAGFVRPRGRRRAPGKPVTYGTTEQFLEHFGLAAVGDLPGLSDLKASGLLDANLPPDFKVPSPTDIAALMPDELPLDAGGDDDEALQSELDLPELDEELDEEPDDDLVDNPDDAAIDGSGER